MAFGKIPHEWTLAEPSRLTFDVRVDVGKKDMRSFPRKHFRNGKPNA
jgi:hypothetical protein